MEDTIERMKKGQNVHGRMNRDSLKKGPGKGGILRRSVVCSLLEYFLRHVHAWKKMFK